jgi:hypothetical protein
MGFREDRGVRIKSGSPLPAHVDVEVCVEELLRVRVSERGTKTRENQKE